jgi:serine O-acetyltransferase
MSQRKSRTKAGQLDELVHGYSQMYAKSPQEVGCPIGIHALPDWTSVDQISERLPELLFPGFFGPGPKSPGFSDLVARRIAWMRTSLEEQVVRSLRYQGRSRRRTPYYRRRAEVVVDSLLHRIPAIVEKLWVDATAAHQGDPASLGRFEIVTTSPGFYAILHFRVAHELNKLGVKLLARMLSELAHSKTGVDIHPGATIGRGFFIDHGTGVVIGETAVIGEYVTLYHGVTLGVNKFDRDTTGKLIRNSRKRRHPKLGDHVFVYANATILGGDTEVGSYSKVGANVRLIESIGPEMLAGIERSNVRITSRQRLGSNAEDRVSRAPCSQADPIAGLDLQDRLALSRLASEGGNNCGEVDISPWQLPDSSD